jgi:hypothetical protein
MLILPLLFQGAVGSDKEIDDNMRPDDPHKYLDINLDE